MSLETEYARIFPQLLAHCQQLRERQGDPDMVPLSYYPTDEDRAAVVPSEPGTAAAHRELMEALVQGLHNAGYPAELRPIRAAEYFSWLDGQGLTNTTEARARYISHARPQK